MIRFPNEIAIAYAICNSNNDCTNNEFIVDGQSQMCNKCGELLYRESVRNYTLKESLRKNTFNDEVGFPNIIEISYATCKNGECDYGEFVVSKELVKCQYCENSMHLEGKKKYYLSYETFICPICGYDKLFFEPYDKFGRGSYDICPNCDFLFFNLKTDNIEKEKIEYLKKSNRR